MNRFLNSLRAIFISFEFLLTISILLLYSLFPDAFTLIGNRLKSENELWKYLISLPLIFTAFAFKMSSKLRAPLENSSNKLLYSWGDYPRLTDIVHIGSGLCIVSCLGSTSIWVSADKISSSIFGCVFLITVGVSGISAYSMFLASQKLREYIEKYS